jgi:hypothetical protein
MATRNHCVVNLDLDFQVHQVRTSCLQSTSGFVALPWRHDVPSGGRAVPVRGI